MTKRCVCGATRLGNGSCLYGCDLHRKPYMRHKMEEVTLRRSRKQPHEAMVKTEEVTKGMRAVGMKSYSWRLTNFSIGG